MLANASARDLYKAGRLVMSLTGMSNMGKSTWSRALELLGFRVISCDDLIESLLAIHLGSRYRGLRGIAEWMGQPHEARSRSRQEIYLRVEAIVLQEINHYLAAAEPENLVIDTTGSLVHTGDAICRELQRRSLMVYLAAGNHRQSAMISSYLACPKPVYFGDFYDPHCPTDTLEQCYPALLDWRQRQYARWADVTLTKPSNHLTAPAFLERVFAAAEVSSPSSLPA